MMTHKVKFNLHSFHNPDCDILEYELDDDTKITYGVYLKKATAQRNCSNYTLDAGDEFMEIYTGANYNLKSTKRSYSRVYYIKDGKIPDKYINLFQQLKDYYADSKKTGHVNQF